MKVIYKECPVIVRYLSNIVAQARPHTRGWVIFPYPPG